MIKKEFGKIGEDFLDIEADGSFSFNFDTEIASASARFNNSFTPTKVECKNKTSIGKTSIKLEGDDFSYSVEPSVPGDATVKIEGENSDWELTFEKPILIPGSKLSIGALIKPKANIFYLDGESVIKYNNFEIKTSFDKDSIELSLANKYFLVASKMKGESTTMNAWLGPKNLRLFFDSTSKGEKVTGVNLGVCGKYQGAKAAGWYDFMKNTLQLRAAHEFGPLNYGAEIIAAKKTTIKCGAIAEYGNHKFGFNIDSQLDASLSYQLSFKSFKQKFNASTYLFHPNSVKFSYEAEF